MRTFGPVLWLLKKQSTEIPIDILASLVKYFGLENMNMRKSLTLVCKV